ncbi:GTP cyclohydrolase II-domain-containing protein [Phlyctochytrium arcticum]|nr:GTP cyclohydrolase II-domain-containing protein [Phlyctochytrium arcticum]
MFLPGFSNERITEQGSPLMSPSPRHLPSPFIPESTTPEPFLGTSSRTSSPPCSAIRPSSKLAPLTVRCEVRTRIPSEFGGVCYLHLYSNSRDSEEHLAIAYGEEVVSQSLEAVRSGDTERERTLRGARNPLPANGDRRAASDEGQYQNGTYQSENHEWTASETDSNVPPLVRIHSCCFTGETLRSLRCDCAEQLQEAMRLMASERRGVVLYLKQEGRGIGLREKLKAYNLIDMGHDTMAANILLGHPSDARSYEIATAILRDLDINRVRLLTNNPEKLNHLNGDGVEVVERVPMIPVTWRRFGADIGVAVEKLPLPSGEAAHGAGSESRSSREVNSLDTRPVHIEDRDEYLVTKVQRMGHILDIPSQLLRAVSANQVETRSAT